MLHFTSRLFTRANKFAFRRISTKPNEPPVKPASPDRDRFLTYYSAGTTLFFLFLIASDHHRRNQEALIKARRQAKREGV